MHRISRRTLALVLAVWLATAAAAGQLTVTVSTPVPGYRLVRSEYTRTVFDDGATRTTTTTAYTITTVGGPNDGHRRTVPAREETRPSPAGVPEASVTTYPEEVIREVETAYETESVTVSYDSDLTLATLTTRSDIDIPFYSYDPPSVILDEAAASVAPAEAQIQGALLASFTADSAGAAAVDAVASERNETLAGDPVSVATGAFVAHATDLLLTAGAVRLPLARVHRTGRDPDGSLGAGWFFSLDSRIVLGESPRAAEAVARAEAIVAELLDPETGPLARVDREMDAAVAERQPPLRAASRAAGEARELAGAFASVRYRGDLEDEVHAALARRAGEAAAIAAELEELVAEIDAEIEEIDGPLREAARALVEERVRELRDRIDRLREVAATSEAHARRNARFAGSARDYAAIGTEHVVLVGTDGHVRRFMAVEEPDPASGAVYRDGSPNRYPAGCRYVSTDPGAPRLRLEPDGTFTLTRDDGVTVRYGFSGELRRVEDANGNAIVLEYDARERLRRLRDSRGREIDLDRDTAGRVTAVRAPGGVELRYAYDADGRLARAVDAAGTTEAYAYAGADSSHRLVAIGSAADAERTFAYRRIRGAWRAVEVVDEAGGVERFDFARPGRTVHTNPGGVRTVYEYDDLMRTTRVVDAAGHERTFAYDDAGRLVAERAEDGTLTRYEHDGAGRVVAARHADGSVERWVRDAAGRPLSRTDRSGRTTRFAYDARGNLVRADHPDGTSDRYEYVPPGEPAAGQVRAHVDRRGNRTVSTFDEHGFLVAVDDVVGPVVRTERDAWGRPLAVTDGVGARTVFTRRADGLVTAVRGPEGLTVEIEYDERGDAVRIAENGRETRLVYDRLHRPVAVTDATGTTTRYTYRADGLPVERAIVAPDGTVVRARSYAYDARGLPVELRELGADAPERREYDARGRLAAVVDAAGARTEYAWNADDRLVRLKRYLDDRPVVERFSWAPSGDLVTRTDALGSTTALDHDPLTRREVQADATGVRTTTTAGPYGLPRTVVDGSGRERRFAYDARGRLIGVWNEAHREATYEYDAANRLVRFTDGEGARWRYRYDGRGRLVEVAHPDGARRAIAYNADGTTAAITDETGLVTRFEYDEVGRLRARLDPAGPGELRRTAYERNVAGELVAITDPTGRTTRFIRDRVGRVTAVADPMGNRTEFELDPVGRVVALTDPTGRTAWYRYDALGRLVARGRGEQVGESFAYDAAGNLLARVDALGHAHRYAYDEAGRLVAETNRSGATSSYRYDAAGRLVESIGSTGLRAVYRYDAQGRLSGADYADGGRLRYAYDRAGRLAVAENALERLELGYDARGRLASVTGSASGTDLAFGYDAAGRRTDRTDRASGSRTAYRYDARGVLVVVDDSVAGTFTVARDAAGRPTGITAPNGTTTETSYDAAGRVAATVTHAATGAVIAGLAHVYDEAGRRRYDIDERSRITSYAYDAAGRLERVEYPFDGPKRAADFARFVALGAFGAAPRPDGGALPGAEAAGPGATVFAGHLSATTEDAAAIDAAFRRIHPLRKGGGAHLQRVWTERFAYDAADNRTAWRTGWGSIEYRYDSKGRLAGTGELAYSYDMAGNLAAVHGPDGTTTYRYSPRDRVVEAATPTGRVTYGYDALGRRIVRTGHPPAGGVESGTLRKPTSSTGARRTSYRYDGLGFAVASRRITRLAGVSAATDLRKPTGGSSVRFRGAPAISSAPGAAGGAAGTYTEIALGGATLAVSGPGGTRYLAHDVLGSVRSATTGASPDAERYDYDAFGAALAGEPSEAMPYGYAGKRRDPVTGHSDYGFRDYAPELARFTTADPARDGANWYVYVRADPVNLVDPWGLEAVAAQITFTMTLDYTHATDTLAMEFRELHDGELVDTVLRSWDASNNRRVREVGSDRPAEFRNFLYYPGPFPEGEWQITSAGVSADPMIGEFLRTDAVIDVQTYEPGLGGYVPGPVRYDEDGFLIHGGGYTSNDLYDPNGNNRWQDNTLGCLRLRNAGMDELAGYARRALESGGAATITVDREE